MQTTSRDPFGALADGEYVLLRGGYGGFAKYIWSTLFGAFAAFTVVMPLGMLVLGTLETQDVVASAVLAPLMTLAALGPWLRSGRYRLTNRALYFKPSLRAPRSIALRQITGLEDMGEHKQGLRVVSADDRIDLRNVSRWQRLWGAIVLYRVEGMDEALPPAQGMVPHLRLRCMHQTGRGRFGQGTLVLRPTKGYVLPDGAQVDALRESLRALATQTTTVRAQLPTLEYVGRLAMAGEDVFDDRLARLAARLEATELHPGQLPGLVRPVRLWKARTLIRLREGFVMIQGSCPTPMAQAAEPWLERWCTRPGTPAAPE